MTFPVPDPQDSVEIPGLSADPTARDATLRTSRPWLGVRFTCSGVYLRVYRNPAGDAYTARCPRCGRTVNFRVGQGGSSGRFYEVRC